MSTTTPPNEEWVPIPASGKRSRKLGFSRARIYELAKAGHVRLAKGIIRRRRVTFVDRVSLKAYLAATACVVGPVITRSN